MKNNRQKKRVLIVDDEPNVATSLADGLGNLEDECMVDVARSGEEAMRKIRTARYTLVITDYKMPGMNGLDLAEAIHQVSPDTQVVLMTAYGTEGLRSAIGKLNLAGYIDKPFSMAQLREIVRQAVAKVGGEDPYRSGKRSLNQSVRDVLKTLQADTGARCVMLISSGGYPVETSGQINGLDITSVGALVAANFVAATELARLLGRGSVFRSSYHEGGNDTDHNIYAYDVNGDLLLVVVFGSESKPGAVWFYTKQAANILASQMAAEVASITGVPGSAIGRNGAGLGEAQVMNISQAIAAGLLADDFGRSGQDFSAQIENELDALLNDQPES